MAQERRFLHLCAAWRDGKQAAGSEVPIRALIQPTLITRLVATAVRANGWPDVLVAQNASLF
jgi:hypothetical protein